MHYLKSKLELADLRDCSNKTPNQMQRSIVTFIVWSHRRRSTYFGHHRAHHQELFQTAVAASGCRVNAEVVVFLAVVDLLLRRQCLSSNKPDRPRTQHDYHHDTKVKKAATVVIELLVMGGKRPKHFEL
jgi:hypothetical protein